MIKLLIQKYLKLAMNFVNNNFVAIIILEQCKANLLLYKISDEFSV